MTDTQSPKWHMRLDKNGALVSADAPLLQLHIDAGGSDNGILALPELLTMADHCQRLQMTLTRAVPVRRNTGNLRLWCRFEPDSKGVSITVEDWRELAADDAPKSQAKTADIKPTATTPDTKQEMPKSETPENIGTGEAVEAVESNDAAKNSDGKLRGQDPIIATDGFVRLDKDQRIIEMDAPRQLSYQPDAKDWKGCYWLDYFSVHGDVDFDVHETMMPWRYIQNKALQFPGDKSYWAVEIFPHLDDDRTIMGYRLLLNRTGAPVPKELLGGKPLLDKNRLDRLFGQQIGPALRQPIGRIIANAESIGSRLQGPLRTDYANYASDIASAGRHLLGLIDDLADMEAIESAGFSAAQEEVDLSEMGSRAAGLLAVKARDKNIIIKEIAAKDSALAIGEFRRVLQILLNLIGNAINYSPPQSTIWINAGRSGDMAYIAITDEGAGIDEHEKDKLFNKWERLGRSGDGGSGLGLYISKRLALAMHGDLTVRNSTGKGAQFTLTLPLA